MSIVLGGRGLSVQSAGGGGANPYEAIAGLNSLWTPDADGIVIDTTTTPANEVTAVQTQSAILNVPVLFSGVDIAPSIAAFNGSKLGFSFDAARTTFMASWTLPPDITDGVSGFTIFASIKTTSASTGFVYSRGLAAERWRLVMQASGTAVFELADNTSTSFAASSDAALNDGLIHNIICIYDPLNAPNPTVTMVVDGVLQATSATDAGNPLQASSDPVAIGAGVGSSYQGALPFTGLMRDVGSYNVPLRGADIAKLNSIMTKRWS